MSIVLRLGSVILQEEFQDIIDQLSTDPNFKRLYESRALPDNNVRPNRSKSVADISYYTSNLQLDTQSQVQHTLKRNREDAENSNFPPPKKINNPALDIDYVRRRASYDTQGTSFQSSGLGAISSSHFQGSYDTDQSPVDCKSSTVHVQHSGYDQYKSSYPTFQENAIFPPSANYSQPSSGSSYNPHIIRYKAPPRYPPGDSSSNTNIACDVEMPTSLPKEENYDLEHINNYNLPGPSNLNIVSQFVPPKSYPMINTCYDSFVNRDKYVTQTSCSDVMTYSSTVSTSEICSVDHNYPTSDRACNTSEQYSSEFSGHKETHSPSKLSPLDHIDNYSPKSSYSDVGYSAPCSDDHGKINEILANFEKKLDDHQYYEEKFSISSIGGTLPDSFSTHVSPPYVNISASSHETDAQESYLYGNSPPQNSLSVNTPNYICSAPPHRRHSISHFPLHNRDAPNEDKVTKWTNVTATITKKYSKQDLLGANDQSAPNDVKLMMGKWKCSKFPVN